jgi:hypothetical protein
MKKTFDDFIPSQYPGATTHKRQTKIKIAYLLLVILGFSIAILGSSNSTQAFGLGLVFPGAGFLQYVAGDWLTVLAHLGLFVLSVVLFVASILLCWFWNGNILAPISVWLLSALSAGSMDHHHSFDYAPLVVLAIISALVAALLRSSNKERLARKTTLKMRRENVKDFEPAVTVLNAKTGLREVKELSLEDLQLLRYAYDRSLQPIDEWNGFTKSFGSQWQGGGTRYQLSLLSYALAMTNYSALPAMRGYLQEAQLNLIEKQKAPDVWSYWRWEKLWGTLNWNPDPFPMHNMMYVGWLGKAIGFYQNATGDLRYNTLGSFTLTNTDGEEYAYDYPKICSVLSNQYKENDYYHISCEPNFMFSVCNMFGNAGLAAQTANLSQQTDTENSNWDQLKKRYRQKHIEEFTYLDGTGIIGKSAYLGYPIAPPGFTDAFSILFEASYMSPTLPDLAAFKYAVAKYEIIKETDDGQQVANMSLLKGVDPATMKPSYGWSMAMYLIAAKEHGDNKSAIFMEEQIEETFSPIITNGIKHYPEQSVGFHAKVIMGKVATTNCQHDLANIGSDDRWINGPLLTKATYPKVQVAKAVSDGTNLELVLYPENEPDIQKIELSQLEPETAYDITGCEQNEQTFSADANGNAKLSIKLDGRTALEIKQH